MRHSIRALAIFAVAVSSTVLAAPVKYEVDWKHTHPSFEADHFGGMSVWRGTFNTSSGQIVLDTDAKTGTVDITIDTTSVNVGLPDLEKHLRSPDFFDVEKFPTATYKGTLANFKNGAPTEVKGNLTMHGVTRPVTLTIRSFKCMQHPMKKTEFCGADATATINREDFGMSWGKNFGFDMKVVLSIQVEANRLP